MQCELCGKETNELFLVLIEGTKLRVCKSCAKYGRVLSRVNAEKHVDSNEHKRRVKRSDTPEPVYSFVDDFGKVVEDARLRKGWKQVELAKRLAIKESLLHKIETSDLEPSVDLARRIEKLLSVKILVEVPSDLSPMKSTSSSSSALTLGDLVKVRKRKK